MKKYFEITVSGRGQFPFDMLRFSRCWPVDTESAMNLEHIVVDARPQNRVVRLGMIGNSVEADHCVARFQSFVWTAEITQEERL